MTDERPPIEPLRSAALRLLAGLISFPRWLPSGLRYPVRDLQPASSAEYSLSRGL